MLNKFIGDSGELAWLDSMNISLANLERDLVDTFEVPKLPLLFVVGAPRSGTTLLTQLLIKHFEIGYINNVAARFWNAPYIGVQLAHTLANRNVPETGLSSVYGSVSGYEGPHEFGHFWQRWFSYEETHRVSAECLAQVDVTYLNKELAAVESVFNRPTIYKNLAACGMQSDFLAKILPKSAFIRLRRDPFRVACSLLKARQVVNNNKQDWFSVRPAEYPVLKDLNYADQIAGQIECIEKHLNRALEECPKNRKLEIDYDDLVTSTESTLERVANLIKGEDGDVYRRPVEISILTEPEAVTIDVEDQNLLRRACEKRFKNLEQSPHLRESSR